MKATWVLGMVAVTGVAALAALAGNSRALPESDPRAAIFARRGCNDCHAVAALGVRARHDVAPDLTYAYGDVLSRYGVDLESFLANPQGVMRLMLSAHLRLTPMDRDSIVQILRGLYAQRVALHR